jgi:hypothetical protein
MSVVKLEQKRSLFVLEYIDLYIYGEILGKNPLVSQI